MQTKGFDCVRIPGASKEPTKGKAVPEDICGRSAGLVTVDSDVVADTKTICCKTKTT